MSENLERAYEKLAGYGSDDALLAILALEERRQSQNYALYWSSDQEPRLREFHNRIEEDFAKFTPDIKVYGLLGGNRSSKTERGAFLATAWLLGKDYFRDEPSWRYVKDLPIPDHGANIWCVGLDFAVIRDVIWNEKLRRGHRHPGLLPQPPSPLIVRCSDSEFQITVDVNGRKSSLTCKSGDSGREKFQSASVDLVWIDEEVDSEIFDECFQRTVDCRGKLLLTLTPLTDIGSGIRKPWVWDLYKEWQQGKEDLIFIKLSALDNPHIPDEEKVKLLEKWKGHPEERARLYGDFVQRSGLVYNMWDASRHMVKRFTVPADWRRIASIDPAATGVTAMVLGAVSPRGDIYLTHEYYEQEKIASDHAKDMLVRVGNQRPDIWIIDAVWGTQRNAETHKQNFQLYREAGIPVRLAPRGDDYGVNVLSEYLNASLIESSRHPKLFVFEGLKTFQWEIEQYTWDSYSKGPQKGLSKEPPDEA